jgi:hypothetical protein
MVITSQVVEFHSPMAANNIAARGFFPVTSMVMTDRPEVIELKQTLFYHSSPQVSSNIVCRSEPYQSIGDKNICG